jgi:hypothetical protein
MRKTDVPEFPWPRIDNYKNKITALWDLLDEMSRFFIESMCESINSLSFFLILSSLLSVTKYEGLGLDKKTMNNLFDPLPQPTGTFSHSIMGLYRYFGHRSETTTCLVHRVCYH